jgi:glycosyltransferase involved in cell wall biosynthesis
MADELLTALDQRLTAAAAVLIEPFELPSAALPPGERAARLLPALVARCQAPDAHDARWLLLTALSGAMPSAAEVLELGRLIELAPAHHVETALLARLVAHETQPGTPLEMTVIDAGVVADVHFCAHHDWHTGIQRVVRAVVPRWEARHDVVVSAWTDGFECLRELSPLESSRVLAHGATAVRDPQAPQPSGGLRLVVPWRSVVVLPEVPDPRASSPLTALARFSGNEVALVGYDMIPVTSAELRPVSDGVIFGQYLTVVKHAHRVAGISRSAAQEFAGFASALAAQGLRGPRVQEVLLTEEVPPPATSHREPRNRPLVVCVGTLEPHKNHRTVLHAAERLWRSGLEFDLRLIGRAGWRDDNLSSSLSRLRTEKRPVEVLTEASDETKWASLREASFTVFVSLHEGYGLPVAESLACGTPVITSAFGSQQEIADLGGCLTVDPRDDDAVTAAMRRLLTDTDELARLSAEATARPRRTWDEYADELWTALVGSSTTPEEPTR